MTEGPSWLRFWSGTRIAKINFTLILLLAIVGLQPVFLLGETKLAPGTSSEGGGDALRQILYVAFFASVLLNSFARQGAHCMQQVPIGVAIVLVWCAVSIIWAIEPDIALRRVVFTAVVTLSLLLTVRALPYDDVVGILSTVFAAVVVADWLVVGVFPDAVHQSGNLVQDPNLAGSWRGIHDNKNEAGAVCAIACLFFLHLTVKYRSFISGPALIVLSLVFLYMTSSKTSFGFLFLAALIGLMSNLCLSRPVLRAVFLVGLVLVPLSAVALDRIPNDLIQSVFDDPAGLTGRVQIWPVVINYLRDHPWLGAGYGSFWSIGSGSPILDYTSSWVTTINHAHNGYLNLALQIGVPGAIVAILALVVLPLHSLFSRSFAPDASRWLICAVLSFCWLRDLLESSLLNRDNSAWVVMVIMYALLAGAVDRAPAAAAENLIDEPEDKGLRPDLATGR